MSIHSFARPALAALVSICLALPVAVPAGAQSRPGIAVGEPNPSAPRRYIVRAGDTVFSIARAAGTSPAALLDLNSDLNPRFLRPGDVILLPHNTGGQPDRDDQRRLARYVVRTGDTISSIARFFGLPAAAIIALNPGADLRYLRVGDVVYVPAGRRPVQAQASISVSPTSGPAGSDVQIRGSGFRPYERIRLLAGPGPYDLRPLGVVRTSSSGRISVSTDLPDTRRSRLVYFALQSVDRRIQAVSEPFRIEYRRPNDAALRVTGSITNRGAECPVMRGNDGRIYSLAGDLDDVRPGDRVLVEGRSAEISMCMQGTTIQVRRITSVD